MVPATSSLPHVVGKEGVDVNVSADIVVGLVNRLASIDTWRVGSEKTRAVDGFREKFCETSADLKLESGVMSQPLRVSAATGL